MEQGAAFASLEQLETLWRPLKANERDRAAALLATVSNRLRVGAGNRGKDLDAMAISDPTYASTLASVVVDITARTLMSSTDTEPMTQMSQAAGGYSFSGSFLSPGGGIFIKNSEWAALGLRRQSIGVIEPYDY